ncbi:uncharacterized protein BDZ99DRAFT_468115, partial [Mytilinidion resinicola]
TVNNPHDAIVSVKDLTVEPDHHLSIILRTSEHPPPSSTPPTPTGLDSTTTSNVATSPMLVTTNNNPYASTSSGFTPSNTTSSKPTSSTYTTVPASLTQLNLKQHTSNPPLPLTQGVVDSKLQAIRVAAGFELPAKTETEILADMANQEKGVMERWMGEQENGFGAR